MLLECRKSNRVRRPSSGSSVRSEVIAILRAAYGGGTHGFPYAGFDQLIFLDLKKSKKRPSLNRFKP